MHDNKLHSLDTNINFNLRSRIFHILYIVPTNRVKLARTVRYSFEQNETLPTLLTIHDYHKVNLH